MRGTALGLALAAAISPVCAQSLTEKQSAAADHLAQVMAIELECPEFQAHSGNVLILMAGYDLKIGDEPLSSRIVGLVRDHRAGLRAAGSKIGCLVGWGLYGPGGQNVPNLLRKK